LRDWSVAVKLVAVLLSVLVLSLAARPAVRAADPVPVELDILTPVTGPGAFIGKSYAQAFTALETLVNKTGGIGGRPLKIVTLDAQTNPQIGLQLANEVIAKHVAVFVDGDPAPVCKANYPLVEANGPVEYCLTPLIEPKPGSYVFSGSVSGDVITRIEIRFLHEHGWKHIAIISSTDASGQFLDQQIDTALALPENKDMQVVAREHFSPTDISVAGQVAAIKGAHADAIFANATGTPIATVLRALKDSGLDVPVVSPSSNLSVPQLEQYSSFVPSKLYFGTALCITAGDGTKGAVGAAQTALVEAIKAVSGGRPDQSHCLAWDPLNIIVSALRKLGPNASAQQVRDYITTLHDWAGTDGMYDFRKNPNRGLGEDNSEIVQWIAPKHDWVQASALGGRLLPGDH
jgi:branched-chain amino acid transport system substrate-binding protein